MTRPVLVLLLGAFGGASVCAQQEPPSRWSITPSVGLATTVDAGDRDGFDLESGGATLQLQVDLVNSAWQWSAHAGRRGIGTGCSHGCEFSERLVVGGGAARLFGRFSLGGGIGAALTSGSSQLQPYVQGSWFSGPIHLQVRGEFQQGMSGIHVPVLVGYQLPLSGR